MNKIKLTADTFEAYQFDAVQAATVTVAAAEFLLKAWKHCDAVNLPENIFNLKDGPTFAFKGGDNMFGTNSLGISVLR